MSFDTPAGSRGVSQPGIAKQFLKLFNKFSAGRIRKTGKFGELPSLVLTTVGSKSGQERKTPLAYFPADGGGWLASVPALPGCIGDGESPEEALADAERAIGEWMDAAKALGRELPGPSSLGQWRQRVPRSLHEKLKIVAAREGVSLNSYVANVLAENVGRVG